MARQSLTVSIFCRRGAAHHFAFADAMSDGLDQFGIQAAILYDNELPRFMPDVGIVWGWRNQQLIGAIRDSGNVLVAEAGYFNNPTRLDFISLGWNGLNGRADFKNKNMPGTRWAKVGIRVHPWRQAGDNVVIIGQVTGDQSIINQDIDAWYLDSFDRLCDLQTLPVVFRPHPKETRPPPPLPLALDGSLDECLKHTHQVITFNSNAAVDAVLAGVPAVSMDQGSMAYQVTSHRLDQRIMPGRRAWMYNLAHTQWTLDEIRKGAAWTHIKP